MRKFTFCQWLLPLAAVLLLMTPQAKAEGEYAWPANYGGVMLQGFYWDSRSMTQATSLWKGGVRSFSTDSASVLRTPEAIGFLPRVSHHVTLKRAEGASSILREYSNGLISGIPRALFCSLKE